MYPPQTSFIPITVALSKFIEQNGFFGNYPFWYLGTIPTKYLIGPVVPSILVGIHRFLPISYFNLAYCLLLISYFLFAAGWGLFAAKLSKSGKVGLVVGVLCLFLPWRFFFTFSFGEVSAILAQGLVPWVLLAFLGVQSSKLKVQSLILSVLAFVVLFLTNSTSSIVAIVGILILSFSTFKRAFLVIFLGWVLATFWYGLNYWLVIFSSPSVGGKNFVNAFVTLLNLLRSLIPVILAFVFVVWQFKPKDSFSKFILWWLTIFGSFTLFRFMADPDFLLDWTAWVVEVEIGLIMIMARNFQSRKFGAWSLVIGFLLIGGWVLVGAHRDFWIPRESIENTAEYQVAYELERITDSNDTVLLSGTTSFWLNSLVDVVQVRGGRDEVSTDRNWRDAVWEVREGVNDKRAAEALDGLGVDYSVVHTESSLEYYHDFKYPQKFQNSKLFENIYEQNGDIIYEVK